MNRSSQNLLFGIIIALMILLYGIGDIITTITFIEKIGITFEHNIVAVWLFNIFGVYGIITMKILLTTSVSLSLIYCYKKGYTLTAIAIAFFICIIGIVISVNNILAANYNYTIIKSDSALIGFICFMTISIILSLIEKHINRVRFQKISTNFNVGAKNKLTQEKA